MPNALADGENAVSPSEHEDGGDNDDGSSDYVHDDDDDDESYESEKDDGTGRTLLFLCEEGQLDIALKRVREWDERFPLSKPTTSPPSASASTSTAEPSLAGNCAAPPLAARSSASEEAQAAAAASIRRELFRKSPTTGNYCLHEIVAGGTSGTSAPELVERLVRRYTSLGTTAKAVAEYRAVFLAQPRVGSNGRTVLHWCAWSKTSPTILRLVLEACPEALCKRDDKSHFSRTPLEIAQRYWPDDEITRILESALASFLPHRLQTWVRLCAERLFVSPHWSANGADSKPAAAITRDAPLEERRALRPFDKKDRRLAGLAPRPWFVASVLGYALQREMKDLALQILSFVGCGSRLESTKRRKKRKARPSSTTGSAGKFGESGAGICNARKKRKTR